jgi:hypothetical protein
VPLLVKRRFFAGFTMPVAAAALEFSLATVERGWTYAKPRLYGPTTMSRRCNELRLAVRAPRAARGLADAPGRFGTGGAVEIKLPGVSQSPVVYQGETWRERTSTDQLGKYTQKDSNLQPSVP